jgi:DNA-binding LacI/PurR family transcriptional regulator
LSIDPGAPTPLYQQVAAHIRQQIVSGAMPVGTQLQPHRELAASYGVSVVTINKALSGLVSEGVLHSRVGRGTFVAVRPAPADATRARGRSGEMFGFVLRDLSSPFFSLVAHAAQQRADAEGVGLLFSSSSNRLDREEEQLRRFMDLGVTGLIIASMSRTYRISEPIRALHDVGFPYVMVSYTDGEDVPFIGLDLDAAGYLATQHLIGLGRRRIGYICDKLGSSLGDLRGRGYRRALRQQGWEVDPAFLYEYPFDGEWNDYKSGYAIGERIAAQSPRPDAMFVFNDLGALGLEDALLEHGVAVPDDVAVIGLDDIEMAGRARVPLTTVRQPTDRIGALAVERILKRLRGEPTPTRELLDPALIVRRSCGALAAADPSRGSTPRPRPPFAAAPRRGAATEPLR